MRRFGKLLGVGLLSACLAGGLAFGAVAPTSIPLFTGPQDPSQIFFYLNTLVQAVNGLSASNQGLAYSTPRNVLDNGGMQVQQRGTGVQTCGTTTIPSSAYAADRWGCNVNVTSGAGSLQVVTTNIPTLPAFNAGLLFYRTSGALLQPQCVMQEIATTRVVQMQQQPVTLSFYAYALAAMVTDNGGAITAYIFTGTGTDQGLQSFTASPAITPAWTGISATLTQGFTLTSSMARYSASFVMPAAAKEAAVALCWTPTSATGAGVTDGFEFTGVQLENGNGASVFEFRPYEVELAVAQRYYYQLTETSAIAPVAPCAAVDTTHTNCLIQTPATMARAPTLTFANGFATPTSTTQATLGACTTLAAAVTVTSTVAALNSFLVNCTATTIPAAGVASFLYSNNGTGIIRASADF